MDWDGLLIPISMLLVIFSNHLIRKNSDNFIDIDTDPFVPIGLKVVSHQKNGLIEYSDTMISPVTVSTRDIRAKGDILVGFKNNRLINANVLDFWSIVVTLGIRIFVV